MGWFSSNTVVSNNPQITQKTDFISVDGTLILADIVLLIFICVVVFLLVKIFLEKFRLIIIADIINTLQQRPATDAA